MGPVNIHEDYKDLLTIEKDELTFRNAMIRLAKIENEIVYVNEMYNNGEIETYEAIHRVVSLLELANEVKLKMQTEL